MTHASIRPGRLLRGVTIRTDSAEIENAVSEERAQLAEAQLAALTESTNELLQAISDAVLELENRRRQSLSELQEVAIELATAAASRVVRTVVDQQAHGVETIVMELVEQIGFSQPIQVLVNPQDAQRVHAASANMPNWPAGRIELISDPSMSAGVCRATSGGRTVISDWRTHLQDIRGVLHEELEDAQVERRGAETADQRVRRFPDRRETA